MSSPWPCKGEPNTILMQPLNLTAASATTLAHRRIWYLNPKAFMAPWGSRRPRLWVPIWFRVFLRSPCYGTLGFWWSLFYGPRGCIWYIAGRYWCLDWGPLLHGHRKALGLRICGELHELEFYGPPPDVYPLFAIYPKFQSVNIPSAFCWASHS